MNSSIQIFSIVVSLLVMLLVTQLIRRRKLREEYALLWFVSSVLLIVLSVERELLDVLAHLLGIAYAPSLLLLGVIALGFILAMHFSISLSRLSEENKTLAQELALLRLELRDLQSATGSDSARDGVDA